MPLAQHQSGQGRQGVRAVKDAALSRRALLCMSVGSIAALLTSRTARADEPRMPEDATLPTETVLHGVMTDDQISQALQDMIRTEDTAPRGHPAETIISEYQDHIYYGSTLDDQTHHIHDIHYETLHFNNGYHLSGFSKYKGEGIYTTDGYPVWITWHCINDWMAD